MITNGTRVAVSLTYPAHKAAINNLHAGDRGTVLHVFRTRVGAGVALVEWNKGFRTTANICDLEMV